MTEVKAGWPPLILLTALMGIILSGSVLSGCSTPGWEVLEQSPFVAGPVLEEGRLFVTSTRYGVTRHLRAYQARTGLELWRVELGSWEDCPYITVHSEQILVGCGDSIQAFELQTGLRQWRYPLTQPLDRPLLVQKGLTQKGLLPRGLTSDGVTPEGSPQQGLVMAVTRGPAGAPPEQAHTLLALSTADGSLVLEKTLEAGARVLWIKRQWVILSGETLTSLDATATTPLWQQPWKSPLAEVISSPTALLTVAPEGIQGLDLETGLPRWTRPTEWRVSPSVLEGLLCYAQGGFLYGIDPETGKEKWSQRIAGVISAPLLTHEQVFVHTAGGSLHVLSAADGEVLWTAAIGAPGTMATVNDQYYVWVGTGQLNAVDLVKRTLLPSIPLSMLREKGADPDRLIHTPLKLEGGRLYGIQQSRRLFMLDLDGEG